MDTGHYLTCDRAGCDHRETVPGITADLIGKPCPKCGDNLLTKEDFDHWERVVEPQMVALRIIEAAAIKAGLVDENDPLVQFNLHHHDGVQTLKITPEPEAGQ